MGFPRQEHWSGLPFPSPGYLPDRGIKPASPASTNGSFTAEPPGKRPLIYFISGVGCCSLLQGIFLTQGSNPGLLHYRQILYCLSHRGSPDIVHPVTNKIYICVDPKGTYHYFTDALLSCRSITQPCLTLLRPHELQPRRLLWVAISFSVEPS